jgi:hypothetical protein
MYIYIALMKLKYSELSGDQHLLNLTFQNGAKRVLLCSETFRM